MCIAQQGRGPLRFEWLKDGESLPLGREDSKPSDGERSDAVRFRDAKKFSVNVLSERARTLSVRGILPEDNGQYVCRVSNAFGEDRVQATLAFRGTRCNEINLLETSVYSKCLFYDRAIVRARYSLELGIRY